MRHTIISKTRFWKHFQTGFSEAGYGTRYCGEYSAAAHCLSRFRTAEWVLFLHSLDEYVAGDGGDPLRTFLAETDAPAWVPVGARNFGGVRSAPATADVRAQFVHYNPSADQVRRCKALPWLCKSYPSWPFFCQVPPLLASVPRNPSWPRIRDARNPRVAWQKRVDASRGLLRAVDPSRSGSPHASAPQDRMFAPLVRPARERSAHVHHARSALLPTQPEGLRIHHYVDLFGARMGPDYARCYTHVDDSLRLEPWSGSDVGESACSPSA